MSLAAIKGVVSLETVVVFVKSVWDWLNNVVLKYCVPIGVWTLPWRVCPPTPLSPCVSSERQRMILETALEALRPTRADQTAEAAVSDVAVQASIYRLASNGWSSGHARITVALLRDYLVYRRTSDPICLKTFLYLHLYLAS